MSAPEDHVPEIGPVACAVLAGRKWKAVVNGYRSLNGQMYGATIKGTVEHADRGKGIYDVLGALADQIATSNADMQYVDSIQVTVFPPRNPGL